MRVKLGLGSMLFSGLIVGLVTHLFTSENIFAFGGEIENLSFDHLVIRIILTIVLFWILFFVGHMAFRAINIGHRLAYLGLGVFAASVAIRIGVPPYIWHYFSENGNLSLALMPGIVTGIFLGYFCVNYELDTDDLNAQHDGPIIRSPQPHQTVAGNIANAQLQASQSTNNQNSAQTKLFGKSSPCIPVDDQIKNTNAPQQVHTSFAKMAMSGVGGAVFAVFASLLLALITDFFPPDVPSHSKWGNAFTLTVTKEQMIMIEKHMGEDRNAKSRQHLSPEDQRLIDAAGSKMYVVMAEKPDELISRAESKAILAGFYLAVPLTVFVAIIHWACRWFNVQSVGAYFMIGGVAPFITLTFGFGLVGSATWAFAILTSVTAAAYRLFVDLEPKHENITPVLPSL